LDSDVSAEAGGDEAETAEEESASEREEAGSNDDATTESDGGAEEEGSAESTSSDTEDASDDTVESDSAADEGAAVEESDEADAATEATEEEDVAESEEASSASESDGAASEDAVAEESDEAESGEIESEAEADSDADVESEADATTEAVTIQPEDEGATDEASSATDAISSTEDEGEGDAAATEDAVAEESESGEVEAEDEATTEATEDDDATETEDASAEDMASVGTDATHPLDALTALEHQILADTLAAEGKVDVEGVFIYAGLDEPDKELVLTWNSGDETPRSAVALVADGDSVSAAVVDLVNRSVVSWETVEGMEIPELDGDLSSMDSDADMMLNRGRLRSVLYQMQLAGIIGPDVGERVKPFGAMLEVGTDCPNDATYVSALLTDASGQLQMADSVVCLFETDAGSYMGETATELVVRTAAATASHHYLVDYIFGQDGTVQGRVTLTGFDNAEFAQSEGDEDSDGTMVAPYLTVVNQDHYFHFRLDVDIDGVQNNFVKSVLTDAGDGTWAIESKIAETEDDSLSQMNSETPTMYQMVNPNAYSGLGDGDKGTAKDSSIENSDIVVWYEMGFHHLPRMEDWPAKPMYWQGFQLVPFNFFELNPSVGE